MLIIDIPLLYFLSWYLERVAPRDNGKRLSPWFLFTKKYWTKERKNVLRQTASAPEASGPNIEQVDARMRESVSVIVRNLTKRFGSGSGAKVAVDGLSLNMYRNQIYCLLGHNGAGKTTTISILTGLIDPTTGYCSIEGSDLSVDMSIIRKSLGVCTPKKCSLRKCHCS